MPDQTDNVEAAVVASFLARFTEDRSLGRERALSEYQAMFSGHEELVAREYGDLTRRPEATPHHEEARIGRFRLIRELGRGGQGVVYLAEDETIGRQVALKVVRRSRISLSPKANLRFEREAGILSRLEQPGICPLYEVGSDEGFKWFAMRYVEGRTLAEVLAQQREDGHLPEWLTTTSSHSRQRKRARSGADHAPSTRAEIDGYLRLVERIARTVHNAHEMGVIHRDIKPSNIVVAPDGSPVVLDFGTARVDDARASQVTLTGEVLGTPAYMSPEQLQERPVDHRTDVWSLGVTLYECLTLQSPFGGTSRHALATSICKEEPISVVSHNSAIPGDLQIVLDWALQKDPADRCPTALDLAEDLRRVRKREPIQARAVSSMVRTKRWAQRNPAVAACLAFSFVVISVCLVASLILLSEARALAGGLRQEKDEKTRALDQYSLMSDASRVRWLFEAEKDLWPLRPTRVSDMERWLGESEAMLARVPMHTAARSMLLARSRSTGAPISETDRPVFENRQDGWCYEVLSPLEVEFEELEHLTGEVRERIAFARSVRKKTVDEHEDGWVQAIEEIRGSNEYGGLTISPQVGLIPLGRDEQSGLWEFWHLETGERPEWEGERLGGHVVPRPEMGLVFVLLPGRFESPAAGGASADQPGPFFFSKFEVMQSQWERIMGDNPSEFAYSGRMHGLVDIRADNPVEFVSWKECTLFTAKLGMGLPTQEQWQYACRGREEAPPWTEASSGSSVGAADVAGSDHGAPIGSGRNPGEDWRSGSVAHAPVGQLDPNRHGLFDMHGNVSEWCREVNAEQRSALVCGGAFTSKTSASPFEEARFVREEFKSRDLGLRPLLQLDENVDTLDARR